MNKKLENMPLETVLEDTDLFYSATDEGAVFQDKGITYAILKQLIHTEVDNIQLSTSTSATGHVEGRIYYETLNGTVTVDVKNGSKLQIGQEFYYIAMNNTGVEISDGKPVFASGVDEVNDELEISLANANSPFTSLQTLGLTTHVIPDGELGLVTFVGKTRNLNTDTFTVGGLVYLGTNSGELTQTRPVVPNRIIIIGTVIKSHETDGIIYVSTNVNSDRSTFCKSYSFTNSSVGSGVYYLGGNYYSSDVNVSLTQVSTTVNFGTAGVAYGAHAFIVAGGSGSVDTGIIGIRVNGTSIDSNGTNTTSDTEVIVSDITTTALNAYCESTKKWLGQVEFELFIVSGSPTTYNLDFNYGLAKYEDIGNKDFTLTNFEVVGRSGATDTAFNIELLHHKNTGWTYASTGFIPGNGAIASWSTDLAPYDNLASNQPFAWKRTSLNQFVDGSGQDGIILRVVVGSVNSVQYMNCHVGGYVETL